VNLFFAVTESDNGIDGFRCWEYSVVFRENEVPDNKVYTMRLAKHEDGWIYGFFLPSGEDPQASAGNRSTALAP
jgi:4-O-beta-D-mannosyl-D-glucose phosphorylase